MQPNTYYSGGPPSYECQDQGPLGDESKRIQNVISPPLQSTVVTVTHNISPVQDHVVWSTFNMAYMNFCCLGLIALVFSVKSRDRKMVGDMNGAVSYGGTARSLNIAATVLSILLIFIAIILVVTGVIRSSYGVH
ncbi:dispanin subfamily A member 2b-like [Pelobates fuscus]|uniref:dispanin subfamily A member 2b-like n=1 Tax=Pelobates fuscus TaxID=191477 RepID=UPI002FE4365C